MCRSVTAGSHFDFTDCRVLITEPPLVRSIKLFAALAYVELVLSKTWLDDVVRHVEGEQKEKSKWLPAVTERHIYSEKLLSGVSLEKTHGFSLAKLMGYTPAQRQSVFKGLTFWVHPKAGPQDDGNDFKVVIRCYGGRVVVGSKFDRTAFEKALKASEAGQDATKGRPSDSVAVDQGIKKGYVLVVQKRDSPPAEMSTWLDKGVSIGDVHIINVEDIYCSALRQHVVWVDRLVSPLSLPAEAEKGDGEGEAGKKRPRQPTPDDHRR